MSNTAFKVPPGTGYMPFRIVVSNPAGPNPFPPPYNAPRAVETADPDGVEPLPPVASKEVLEYESDPSKPAIVVRIK
jgi:hypothetical protein